MTQQYVNFLSYNSTGLNEAKIKWINDLIVTTNASFIGIQEHFRKSKAVDDIFKLNFPTNNCYIKPGYRPAGQEKGRPRGGLGQLLNKKLDVKVNNLQTENFRIQAQLLNFPFSKLLWLNVYFPTDPQTIKFDDTELLETIRDIEKVLDNVEYDDIV